MYYLGVMYLKGEGIEHSDEQAFKWLKKSADLGWTEACEEVSRMYEEGMGVERSSELADFYRGAPKE